ncbi:penicillin-binding protein 2 [Thiomicrospira microaerophila]|uniref:peptidoglycan D,D-transpeptidase FtsI family protein n=1 Tax=Thiomicrospira microaerophila TaxID=406020 RepID=UPI00200FAA18|nr:penicillin-binding protein 2 [Thiomicrospira microaerophila]UQB42633.1 penicillin-binding protein 2 [Thiomicrospira microaerophila]
MLNFSREKLMFGLILFGFGLLIAKAFYVQVVQSSFLESEANKRQIRTLEVAAPRGQILDRHGELLALSTPVASVWVDPRTLVNHPQAIEELARVLNLSQQQLTRRIQANPNRRFLYIERSILPDLAKQIEALRLPGVNIQAEFKRYYPTADIAAHILGYTNIDDIGQDGVELIYENWLKGQPGRQQIIKDLEGRVVKFVNNLADAQPGQALQLSIDKDIQFFVHRALKEVMTKHQARGASAVILDAKTGEILALVNQPGYNPNNRNQLQGEAIRNRAISELIEPGSTIKPFVVAKALDLGLIQADEVINTSPGYIRVQGHMISDAVNYGRLTIGEVIQKSSNVATANIVRRMSAEQQWRFYSDLGFSQDLGLFLPGEQLGRLRHHREWQLIDQVSSSFGYGFSTNVMQLAQAYLVFANQGNLPPVSLIKRDAPPEMKSVLSAQAVEQTLQMMETVTHQGGTGTEARIEGYRVAGKTGTVLKAGVGGYQEATYRAMFVGLVPASRPDMVMAIMVDEPSRGVYGGGSVAAPVFQEVMRHALRLRNVDPDGAL